MSSRFEKTDRGVSTLSLVHGAPCDASVPGVPSMGTGRPRSPRARHDHPLGRLGALFARRPCSKIVEAFEAAHPHIRVEYQEVPGDMQGLQVQLIGGVAPDIYMVRAENMPVFVSRRVAHDLTALYERDISVEDYLPAWGSVLFDGRFYGVPAEGGGYREDAMFVNRDSSPRPASFRRAQRGGRPHLRRVARNRPQAHDRPKRATAAPSSGARTFGRPVGTSSSVQRRQRLHRRPSATR